MQTFLVYPSFPHAVAVLDRNRLCKQRLENMQLLKILQKLNASDSLPKDFPSDLSGMVQAQRKNGYGSHPAARMWKGHESALAVYQTFTIREWKSRGYVNNIPIPYTEDWEINQEAVETYTGPLLSIDRVVVPPWLGEEVFHAGHRARLLHKSPDWYNQFCWREAPSLSYTWPHQLGYDYN